MQLKILAESIPVRQVLIETRVVIVNDNYSRELGVRFGSTSANDNSGNGLIGLTGTAVGSGLMVGSPPIGSPAGSILPVNAPPLPSRYNVNLPVASPAGSIALAILGNDYLVDLELSALQAEGEALYFVADYHALTSLRDPEMLRANSHRVALDFLACGLDPERATLFRHSDVPQVTELAWILSTIAPMGLLERAHSYKDKLARGMSANVGLFSYPILMAADILIYDSDVVPVGKFGEAHGRLLVVAAWPAAAEGSRGRRAPATSRRRAR